MMKPWQRGYSVEHLLSILPKFDSWNHYISGPFKEVKKNNLPIWLEENQIKEFKNLVTYVSSVSKKNTPIKMYSDMFS